MMHADKHHATATQEIVDTVQIKASREGWQIDDIEALHEFIGDKVPRLLRAFNTQRSSGRSFSDWIYTEQSGEILAQAIQLGYMEAKDNAE